MPILFDDDGNVVITGNLTVQGTFNLPAGAVSNTAIASDAGILRTKLAEEALAKFPIALDRLRIHDALHSPLGATATSDDDLAYDGGTFGTDSPLVTTTDVVGTSKTRRARVLERLPAEYVAGQDVRIRISAGVVGGPAQVSCTVDVECYESNKTGGVGSDLCATAAVDMNSASFADKDFVITAGGLAPGDLLDIRITIAINDTGGAGACEGAIGSLELLCDIRG